MACAGMCIACTIDPLGLEACHQETKNDQGECDVPNLPGARFDHEYYREKHMPLVKARMGDSCKYSTVDKGIGGGAPRCTGYLRRHVPYLLRLGRSVSSWLRTTCEGDHGGHSELHRSISGDSGKRSGCRVIWRRATRTLASVLGSDMRERLLL